MPVEDSQAEKKGLNKQDTHVYLRIVHSRWFTPIILLILTILGFGLLLPKLGFYQDEWTEIWFGRIFGSRVYVDFFAPYRPFLAGIYLLTTNILGDSPITWHIFALVARFLAALTSYFLVMAIWPGFKHGAAFVAVVYLIYPGFRQQFIPVVYGQYFIQYVVGVLSLILMIYASRSTKGHRLITVLAILAAIFALFTSEYFFGIELMRPLIIGIVLLERTREISAPFLKRVLLNWLPYLSITITFLIWRIFIFRFPTYQPVNILASGSNLTGILTKVRELVGSALLESVRVSLLAWVENWRDLTHLRVLTLDTIFIFGVACAGSLVAFFYFSLIPALDSRVRNSLQMLLLGAVGVVGAGIPFWFVGLSVNTIFYGGSRLLVSFMLAASLILGGLLTLIPHRILANGIASVIVGMGLVRHLEDTLVYREIHKLQASFFQQLAWRAPAVEPGTVLLVNHFQSGELMGDNSLTSAMNFIYDQDPPYNLNNILFYMPDRLVSGDLPGIEPGIDFLRKFRTVYFEGTTDKVIVLYYDPPACLRILDPRVDGKLPRPSSMPITLYNAVKISNLAMIKSPSSGEAQLPAWLFKYQYPKDSWCYYFEKADLARQKKDWKEIVRLAKEVDLTASKAQSVWELIPFIEGFSRAGEWEQAKKLTLDTMNNPKQSKRLTESIFCRAWMVLVNDPESDDLYRENGGSIMRELGCNQ